MADQLTAWPGSCCGTDHLEERMSFGQLLRLAGTVMLVIDLRQVLWEFGKNDVKR